MGEAFAWGLVAGLSLIVGGFIARRLPISRRLLGLIMAFGAGVLISAVAYELDHEASETSAGDGGIALGLLAGSTSSARSSSTAWAGATRRARATDTLRTPVAPSRSGSSSTASLSPSSSASRCSRRER
jgi:hypothetical protein